MVSAMRMTTAAPLPQATARFCCWAGNPRAASAITTALSPDSTMFTPMISSSAIQNSGLSNVIECFVVQVRVAFARANPEAGSASRATSDAPARWPIDCGQPPRTGH